VAASAAALFCLALEEAKWVEYTGGGFRSRVDDLVVSGLLVIIFACSVFRLLIDLRK